MNKSRKIFLLRHGLAGEPGAEYPDDSQRPLTPEGASEIKNIAKGMKVLGLEFERVLASPFVRTRQTAANVVMVLNIEKRLELSEVLKSGAAPKNILSELKKNYSGCGSLLIVGHEPDLSRLVSLWVSGGEQFAVQFKKGGLCKLTAENFDPGSAILKWMLTPKQLLLLGKLSF